jgi:hypothetical protein
MLTAAVALGSIVVASAGSAESRSVAPAIATPAPAPALRAAVTAKGAAVGPPAEWQATRIGLGRYTLEFLSPVTLTVDVWDVAASVTLRPISDRSWQIDFAAGPEAVDASFSFTAVADPGR